MHNLTKIRLFRILLWLSYLPAFIFVFPFSLLRKKNKGQLFFFFDRYCIGGAQRVHLDILSSVEDIYKQVYFTRQSPDDKLKKEFYSIQNSMNSDIHFWCDNLIFRILSVHYFAFYINRHKHCKVLSSNSTFFYDMLPFINKHIIKIELLHNFSYGKKGMEFFGLANYKFLNYRMVIDGNTLSGIKNQYNEFNIPAEYAQRIRLIEAGTNIPASLVEKDQEFLNVLYAGRGGAQKRVWLISRIAENILPLNKRLQFHFAGPVENELSDWVKANAVLHGEIGDRSKIAELYDMAHIIILTSAYEGFPMVIKEGMARGAVPVVTALEGNKTHLVHLQNSMLIQAIEDEDACVQEASEYLIALLNDKSLLNNLSRNAYEYAKNNFSRENFLKAYRLLLMENCC